MHEVAVGLAVRHGAIFRRSATGVVRRVQTTAIILPVITQQKARHHATDQQRATVMIGGGKTRCRALFRVVFQEAHTVLLVVARGPQVGADGFRVAR